MSYKVVIDTARPGLENVLIRASDRTSLHAVIARSATRTVRLKFANVATWMRNRWGRPAQFWKRMNRATHPEHNASAAYVVMPREVAQRRFGGPLRPTGGKQFLTIPATARAYRRSARSFPDAIAVLFREPKGLAVGMIAQVHPGKGIEALYWLVRGVNQKGDPRVLPTMQEFDAGMKPDINAWLLRKQQSIPPKLDASATM